MKIKYAGAGFTPIPNKLIDLWPLLLRLRGTPQPERWRGGKRIDCVIEPRLQAIDLVILCALFRMAYAGATRVGLSQTRLAALSGIKERNLRDRLGLMEAFGMLAIDRRPGKPAEIDLDRLVAFLDHFQAPPLAPVESSGDPSTTPARECRGTPARECRGQKAPNQAQGQPNQVDTGSRPGDNKQYERQDLVETTLQSAEFSPPRPPKELTPEALHKVLVDLICDVRDLPDDVRKHRGNFISSASVHGIGTLRQAVEALIRMELRNSRFLGVKTRIVDGLFRDIPLDGLVYWLNRSYGKRNPAGFLLHILDRTRGAYPGRTEAVA